MPLASLVLGSLATPVMLCRRALVCQGTWSSPERPACHGRALGASSSGASVASLVVVSMLLLTVLSSTGRLQASDFVVAERRLADALRPERRGIRAARQAESLAAIAWREEDEESPLLPVRPSPPNTTEAMCQQAADAAMRAYRDGFTRQSVRLRLDAAIDREYDQQLSYLLKAAMPLARSFATKLWGGKCLKQVKTSIVDEEVTTLLYREAESALMDSAVMFLPSRDVVTSPVFFNFIHGMGDRLVVLSNSESANANWRVENKGKDFYDALGARSGEVGEEICRLFSEQSYYFYEAPMNNWQTTIFRAYPFAWEIYIEDLNYNMVKVGEAEKKPSYEQIMAFMESYEAKNGIRTYQKVGKFLKDNQRYTESDMNPAAV